VTTGAGQVLRTLWTAARSVASTLSCQRTLTATHSVAYVHRKLASGGGHWAGSPSLSDAFTDELTARAHLTPAILERAAARMDRILGDRNLAAG
jgi:hypothetical protein